MRLKKLLPTSIRYKSGRNSHLKSFETVHCYRERQGDDFYIGVTGNGKWAFFNVGDIFFDLMKGETVTLRYIAEMLPEPSGEGDDTDEK